MIKVMTFIKRKEGLSQEEFVRHYEEVHAPLALKLLPHPKKYVRNHIVATTDGGEPGFDCISEFWYDSAEAAQAVTDVLGAVDVASGYTTEIGRIFREDEERFMDRSKRFSCVVDERVSHLR
jgi:uncharacterized protein (TIGR02118 family)